MEKTLMEKNENKIGKITLLEEDDRVWIWLKEPMGLYKMIVNFFKSFFIFSYERIFEWIFSNLLLKIHIVARIYHMVCVKHCWINMNFSKCVDFAKHVEIYHNFESYQNMLTTLGFFFVL
jgi:hypothetical protein